MSAPRSPSLSQATPRSPAASNTAESRRAEGRAERSAAFLRNRGAVLGLSLASLVGIALADLATGYELALSLFYVIPVAASTWALGLRAGLALSFLATLAWLATDFFTAHHYTHPMYRYWEGFIRLATFSLFAFTFDQLKRALARSDDRLIKVLEGLDAAVCVIDPASGALLYRNQPFDAVFPHEARGRAAQRLLEAAGMFETHERSGEEMQLEQRWYLVRGRRMNWTDGRRVLLLSATDVTARRRSEASNREQQARLQATARLVSLGEIASSIAHELNQPLAAISSYVHGCVRRLRSGGTDPQALAGALEQAGEQAERAGRIVTRVRDFVRSRQPVLAALDLNALVARASAAAAQEAGGSAVRVALHLAPGLPQAQADDVMIEQVILNLMRNAAEAMHGGAEADRLVDVTTSRDASDALKVSVADRGPGVSADSAGRLFEPFFTSKPEGMGLGLNICRSIVEFHGGRLWTTPREGGGAEFHFTLRTAGDGG